ncbi:putative sterile alpha motif containing protein [Lyophyllum shimeji]|uniref:Sterile alpha motif containing protein n=1 Tax=Lyophyllum shimeji TaxID=47721 RepID=A0A9P3PJF1_LYOSH|nr:putative sterile alpha motif containing protein [Lyophyllum shimeji]
MSTSVEISKAAPTSATELAPEPLPTGGQGANSSAVQGLDLWLENFRKYEATLQEVTITSAQTRFKAELNTMEQWFKALPEAERTAAVYTLMLQSNQDQIRFFISVLQQMIRPEVTKPEAPVAEDVAKPKIRPPSLNLPLPGSPTTPTPVTANAPFPQDTDQVRPGSLKVNTTSIFEKGHAADGEGKKPESATAAGLPGLGVLSPFHLNMLANAGLSAEAQLLAVQLIMSGIVQPVGAPPASQRQSQAQPKKLSHLGDAKNWRTPTSAKYPGSALRSSGLRASALKSAGLKSAGLHSASLPSAGLKSSGLDSAGGATPREEDFDPEMLNDIPAWLRSLRLHKYTSCFDGLTWQEMVVLDDATLEAKGVAALGARRRLLRTFEHARKKTGMDNPESATPTTSSVFPSTPYTANGESSEPAPRSAAPPSKLSITSPVFVPSFERGPQSAAPAVSATESAPST